MLVQHYNVISVKLEGTFEEMWPSISMVRLDMQSREGVSTTGKKYNVPENRSTV